MRSKRQKTVHKRLKNKKGTKTPKTNKSPVVLTLPPVPHTYWVRPNWSEAHRMYTIKLMNEKGKTLIVIYRSSKDKVQKIYDKILKNL